MRRGLPQPNRLSALWRGAVDDILDTRNIQVFPFLGNTYVRQGLSVIGKPRPRHDRSSCTVPANSQVRRERNLQNQAHRLASYPLHQE